MLIVDGASCLLQHIEYSIYKFIVKSSYSLTKKTLFLKT